MTSLRGMVPILCTLVHAKKEKLLLVNRLVILARALTWKLITIYNHIDLQLNFRSILNSSYIDSVEEIVIPALPL